MANIKFSKDDFNLTNRNPWFITSLLEATIYPGILIGTTGSGISDELRDIYSICR
jgi:hypothetical protein